MKRVLYYTAICILILLSSCAQTIYVNYQPESSNTSKIILKPNRPTERTFVTVNDNLLVDKKFVKSVTINNVPTGNHIIHYTSDNIWYKDKLDAKIPVEIDQPKEITKLIVVPPMSAGYYVYLTGLLIIPWLPLLAY